MHVGLPLLKEWNEFVETFEIVPFTARRLADVLLAENWSGRDPWKRQQAQHVEVPSSSGDQPGTLRERTSSCLDRAASNQIASPGWIRSYAVDFHIGYDDLEIHSKIGEGGHGSVYKAVWKAGHIVCAVKMLNQTGGDDSSSDEATSDHEDGDGSCPGAPRNDFERETALLRELRHPSLVVCYGICRGGPGVP